MTHRQSYSDYVADKEFMDGYVEYQQKYATSIRESDRVIIELVTKLCSKASKPLTLLDLGCSTGNLLLHLKHARLPLALSGGEMAASVVEQCQTNPDLSEIEFHVMDALDIGKNETFDIVVVNAVFYLFSKEEFLRAITSVYNALKPGGTCIIFDFFHPYEQDLIILETSKTHALGLTLHMRSFSQVQELCSNCGFSNVAFRPFEIPIDLPEPEALDDIRSHTKRRDSGDRLLFRGALYQPWCHLSIQRST